MTEKDRKNIKSDWVYMQEAAYQGQKESYLSDFQVAHELIVDELFNKYENDPYFAACSAFLAGIAVGKRLERGRQLKAHTRGFNLALEYVRQKQKETLKELNEDCVYCIKQLQR